MLVKNRYSILATYEYTVKIKGKCETQIITATEKVNRQHIYMK